MPQLGFAVVLLQLLRKKHKAFLGCAETSTAVGIIEGEDGERAVDDDRFLLLVLALVRIAIEHDAAGVASHAGLARFGEDFVGPEGDDPGRCLRIGVRFPKTEVVAPEVQRRTPDQQFRPQHQGHRPEVRVIHVPPHLSDQWVILHRTSATLIHSTAGH